MYWSVHIQSIWTVHFLFRSVHFKQEWNESTEIFRKIFVLNRNETVIRMFISISLSYFCIKRQSCWIDFHDMMSSIWISNATSCYAMFDLIVSLFSWCAQGLQLERVVGDIERFGSFELKKLSDFSIYYKIYILESNRSCPKSTKTKSRCYHWAGAWREIDFSPQCTLCITRNVILDHDEKSEEKILIIQDSHHKQLFVKLTATCESFWKAPSLWHENSHPKITILLKLLIF